METLKVMVVDDEERMRKLVRDFLVRKNFEVIEAGDGAEAVDTFFSTRDIALIILDVMMPPRDPEGVEGTDHHADSQIG